MLNGYQRHKRNLQETENCMQGENSQAYSRVLTNLNDCFVTMKTTPGLLSIKALEVLHRAH